MNWYKMANKTINIGVVGFSTQEFDKKLAKEKIKEAFDIIEKEYKGNFVIISGLTDLGIPSLAYKEAVKRKWKTVGGACQKANEYKLFDCDEKIIIGDDWGDESKKFLSMLDILVKIGGGKQSTKEFEEAKKLGIKTFEYKL